MRRSSIIHQLQLTLHQLVPDAKIVLFGSQARGDARPDSDIDLLILIASDPVPVKTEKEIIGFLSDLSVQTGVIISSIILPRNKWENRAIKSPFYLNVIKEGVTI